MRGMKRSLMKDQRAIAVASSVGSAPSSGIRCRAMLVVRPEQAYPNRLFQIVRLVARKSQSWMFETRSSRAPRASQRTT